MYEFNWRTPCFGGAWALHGIEIPFVFGNLEYGIAWDGHDSDAERTAADPQGVRMHLAQQTMRAWAAFARTGNPSHAGLPQWQPYSADARETMALGAESQLQSDPRREERLFMEGVLRA